MSETTLTTPMMRCGHAANSTANGQPACAICAPRVEAYVTMEQPDLAGREARCCKETGPVPSSPLLAFFEFRGEGSRSATDVCRNCGYAECAHGSGQAEDIARGLRPRRNVVDEGRCLGFVESGGWRYDGYYCGHSGWD